MRAGRSRTHDGRRASRTTSRCSRTSRASCPRPSAGRSPPTSPRARRAPRSVRRLESGRDALRAAPLLELPEAARRELLRELPERRERFDFLAPFRHGLARAAPALAALVLIAGVVALATRSKRAATTKRAGTRRSRRAEGRPPRRRPPRAARRRRGRRRPCPDAEGSRTSGRPGARPAAGGCPLPSQLGLSSGRPGGRGRRHGQGGRSPGRARGPPPRRRRRLCEVGQRVEGSRLKEGA